MGPFDSNLAKKLKNEEEEEEEEEEDTMNYNSIVALIEMRERI